MYRIIACDLDDTLLDDNKQISKQNIEAIAKAGALGVKFVPCTGRGFKTVKNTLKTLNLYDKIGEYVISFNGSAITENKHDKELSIDYLDTNLTSYLYDLGLSNKLCTHVYTKEMTYVYDINQDEYDFLNNRMEYEVTDAKSLDFLQGQSIVKMLFMNRDFEVLNKIKQQVLTYTQDLDISFSSNRYIEFNKKGVNKGQGLIKLAQLLNVDIKDTIAIGDNYNDLTMIQTAGLGVGVANSAEGIRLYCKHITKANCNQSAVAEVINDFILN